MNKYIIVDESGKQWVAGPVTIKEPDYDDLKYFPNGFRNDALFYEDQTDYENYLASLPKYEWEGEKRKVGDVVELGKDFKWGLKAYCPPLPETEEDYQMALHDAKHELPPSPKKVAIPLSKAPSNEAKMCGEMSKKTLAHALKAEEVKSAIYKENPEWPSSGIGLVMDGGTPIRQEDLIFKAEEVKEKEDGKPMFEEAVRKLINSYSLENDSDTPDYILAQYLSNCLAAYNKAVKSRDKWFGVDMWAADKIAK